MSEPYFTVGDLRRQLQYLSDDTKLTFGGGVTFYRVRNYDDDGAYIEWSEPQADLPPAFRKRNPHIKVAFVNTDSTEWDEEGLLGSIDVSIR